MYIIMQSSHTIVYEQNNSDTVLKYLKRKYGTKKAKDVYTNKLIESVDMVDIDRLCAQMNKKCKMSMKPLNYEDKTIKEICIKYMIRTYGETTGFDKWMNKEFTEFDLKMIHVMVNLKNKYKECENNRGKTQQLTMSECRQLQQNTYVPKEVIRPSPTKPTVAISYCKAIKMNGEQCKAKIKNGAPYCAKHIPKNLIKD